ncbi:HEPN domain-containing protein [Bartonella sp. LJL80]
MMDEKLEHLPPSKRRTIARAVEIILREFDAQFIGKPIHQNQKRRPQIVKIILFGSHARGGYVNDNTSGYHSDYDFCVLVNYARYTDFDYWFDVNASLEKMRFTSEADQSRPTLVVHSFPDMNGKLRDGWPFFVDIVEDGITLYELPGYDFGAIGPMTAERRKEMATKWYHEWLHDADEFFVVYKFLRDRDNLKLAAFNLHQTTECLYNCLILTLSLYSPKQHDLRNLHQRAVGFVPELKDLWPANDRFAKRAFERLRDAYVKARYSPKYEITNEELDWLETRIKILREKVVAACSRIIA